MQVVSGFLFIYLCCMVGIISLLKIPNLKSKAGSDLVMEYRLTLYYTTTSSSIFHSRLHYKAVVASASRLPFYSLLSLPRT